MAQPTLRLDATRCTAGGTCRARLPERLRAGAGGRTELLSPRVTPAELAAVREVVLACPSGALRLDDDPLYDFPNVGP